MSQDSRTANRLFSIIFNQNGFQPGLNRVITRSPRFVFFPVVIFEKYPSNDRIIQTFLQNVSISSFLSLSLCVCTCTYMLDSNRKIIKRQEEEREKEESCTSALSNDETRMMHSRQFLQFESAYFTFELFHDAAVSWKKNEKIRINRLDLIIIRYPANEDKWWIVIGEAIRGQC
jgi:hypothetical protein